MLRIPNKNNSNPDPSWTINLHNIFSSISFTKPLLKKPLKTFIKLPPDSGEGKPDIRLPVSKRLETSLTGKRTCAVVYICILLKTKYEFVINVLKYFLRIKKIAIGKKKITWISVIQPDIWQNLVCPRCIPSDRDTA